MGPLGKKAEDDSTHIEGMRREKWKKAKSY